MEKWSKKMTKKEMIKKLQERDAHLWNGLKRWKSLSTEEEIKTCSVYKRRLRDWSKMNDVLRMLDVKVDYKLYK